MIDTDTVFLYLLQILVAFKYGAFVPDIPIVAIPAAERFGLRTDRSCVHDFGEIVVGFAEIRQQLVIACSFACLAMGHPTR